MPQAPRIVAPVDMAEYASNHATHIKGTADSYEAKLKQFDIMLGLKEGEVRTAAHFTDANQAAFLECM
jgi:hypothetical protein